MSNTKILFLDYDGVVNTPMWNPDGKRCRYNMPEDGKVNNFQAVQWVSEFCEKFGFAIVVTSDWRRDSNWLECLVNGGLRETVKVIDKTGEDKTRGREIDNWLKEHPEVEYYYILDDLDQVMGKQKPHFIQTDPSVGFSMTEFMRLRKKYLEDVDAKEQEAKICGKIPV